MYEYVYVLDDECTYVWALHLCHFCGSLCNFLLMEPPVQLWMLIIFVTKFEWADA